jgi:FKBP-type peptidyl-prolyl cis-trans isomerase (trigger factor)
MDLTIDAIAREEKIVAPDEEVEAEVKHLMEHYQDADPMRATSYFRHIIRNEKVFQFLETQ